MVDTPLELLRAVFGESALPKPFDLLEVAQGLAEQSSPSSRRLSAVAKKLIAEMQRSGDPVRVALALPKGFAPEPKQRTYVQTMLGQLLLGFLAERAFESIYKRTLGTSELHLEDAREGRTDTDYRVLNGKGRQIFRINIKFHGTLFRQAKELVGLAPEDCFALAAYKIKQGLDKQEREVIPYLFVVVSCPVSALDVGAAIPKGLVDLACLIHASKKVTGKRKIEEKIIEHLASGNVRSFDKTLENLASKLESAIWRVISARRADKLLREKLFDRMYAVRVRSFTRSYRNAEVDMHFSLAEDMTPLTEFLKQLGEIGLPGMMGKLERGLL